MLWFQLLISSSPSVFDPPRPDRPLRLGADGRHDDIALGGNACADLLLDMLQSVLDDLPMSARRVLMNMGPDR
jgi:hypothetical protein